MSEDCQAKPRPRPASRTRPPVRPQRQNENQPDSAAPKAPLCDINGADKHVNVDARKAKRRAPSPPNRSPASNPRSEGSIPRTGSLTRSTSGSSNSSPIVAMRSEAAKLATMATDAERRVKEMLSLRGERDEQSDMKRSVTLPSIRIDQQEKDDRRQDVVLRERRGPPDRPPPFSSTSQINSGFNVNMKSKNTSLLTRVSQKPEKLDITSITKTDANTLAVQYPGYTPTTPPDIDLNGGQLVRFAGGFEICDTYATKEYDRRNKDSNPFVASAEFELEKRVKTMDLYIVELQKAVHENGPAAQTGQISVGDQIVEVDGHSLVGVSAKTTREVFSATSHTVRLQLARERSTDNENSDVTDSASELEAVMKGNRDLLQKVASLEYAKTEAEAKLLEVRSELVSAHGLIEELQSMKEEAALLMKSLEDLLSEQTARCNDAESEKALAAADAVTALEQLQKEEEQVAQLQARIAELEQHANKSLESEQSANESSEAIGQLHDELEESRQQLREWEEAYMSLNESHNQTLQELEAMKTVLAEEREACKQAEDDVAELDEAVIGEQERANKLQEKLALVEESLHDEVTARKQLEVEHAKILEAEKVLRQKAERDLEELQRKISDGQLVDVGAITNKRGAKIFDSELNQAIPPTELLDVSASKERVWLSSYSHRRRPSQYLLKRYAQEEQDRMDELLHADHRDDIETIQEQDDKEGTTLEGVDEHLEPIGVQVHVESDQTDDDIQNKCDLQTPISLPPVRETEPIPRKRAATTNSHTKPVPLKPVRKSSLTWKPIAEALTKEGEDEVDAAAFKRSFTVSGRQGQSVKALGALLSQQLPMKPSNVKKRQASLPVVSPRSPPSTTSQVIREEVVSDRHDSVQDEEVVCVTLTKSLPEENMSIGQQPPVLSQSCQSLSSDETNKVHVDTDGDGQDQNLEIDNINVEVDIDKESRRPKPPTRPPPAFPLPTLHSPSALSTDTSVDNPTTDTHEEVVTSEDVSETSSPSSTSSYPFPISPSDRYDVTPDASIPIPYQHTTTVLDWGLSEVSKWLEVIKLEQYIPVFQEHGVEGSHLPGLDEPSLKAMGVSNAHRVIIKKEIKIMKSQLEKLRKMEKKRAEEEAKLERKRLKDETKSAKKKK